MEVFERVPVNQEDFGKAAEEVLEEVLDTLKKKNRDYGGASFDMGLVGNYVHVHDKESRLRHLTEALYNGTEANFESLEDTYKDLIGYSVIGVLLYRAQIGGKNGSQEG